MAGGALLFGRRWLRTVGVFLLTRLACGFLDSKFVGKISDDECWAELGCGGFCFLPVHENVRVASHTHPGLKATLLARRFSLEVQLDDCQEPVAIRVNDG